MKVSVIIRRSEISLSNRQSADYFGFSIKGIKVGDVALDTTDEKQIQYFLENKLLSKFDEATKLLFSWFDIESYDIVGLKIITNKKNNNGFCFYVEFIFEIKEVTTDDEILEILRKGMTDIKCGNYGITLSYIMNSDNANFKKLQKIYNLRNRLRFISEQKKGLFCEFNQGLDNIFLENGIIVAKKETTQTEEIELKVEIDLRNCETREDVADAFEVATGNDFDMKFDEDLNDCKNLSSAIVFYSKNYISIDNKNGQQCYYNEICDTIEDSIDLYYYNAIKKEIEENKKIVKTRYWGEQWEYPIINETVDYKIMDGFENSKAYKCILQRAMNAADIETESWVMIDIEKFKDYTFDNETKLLYVETYVEGEFQHKGSSLSEETNMYQRLSPIFYRNEFQENFDIYKRDEDGNFTEEKIEYDLLSFEITNYLKNKDYDSDTVYFLFCDEDGDELNKERKSVFEDKELKIPENCKILQILGKTNPLIRD